MSSHSALAAGSPLTVGQRAQEDIHPTQGPLRGLNKPATSAGLSQDSGHPRGTHPPHFTPALGREGEEVGFTGVQDGLLMAGRRTGRGWHGSWNPDPVWGCELEGGLR